MKGIVEQTKRLRIGEFLKKFNIDKKNTKEIDVETEINGEKVKQKFKFSRITTYREGCRLFFLCPECSRRVNDLYLPEFAKGWACRFCHDLLFSNQAFNKTRYWEEIGRREQKKRKLEAKMNKKGILKRKRFAYMTELMKLEAEEIEAVEEFASYLRSEKDKKPR